jgi:acetyltransferase-like isoleucine patch superfamily enzyme
MSPNVRSPKPWLELSEDIRLGPGHDIGPGVYLGWMSGRHIKDHTLNIGPGACIRSGTVIYAGVTIGAQLETGHNVVIREENVIGDSFSIWNNATIDYGCIIGNDVKVHCNVYIAQFTVIEDGAFLAPGVTVANDPHPGCPSSKECMRGPTIKRGAQIGANVTLLPFVIIGEGAVIGAGSVVTRDVPPYALAYGNPARVVRDVRELRCDLGHLVGPYGAAG